MRHQTKNENETITKISITLSTSTSHFNAINMKAVTDHKSSCRPLQCPSQHGANIYTTHFPLFFQRTLFANGVKTIYTEKGIGSESYPTELPQKHSLNPRYAPKVLTSTCWVSGVAVGWAGWTKSRGPRVQGPRVPDIF